jgi:DNA-binding NarL/FixJ family response regulator
MHHTQSGWDDEGAQRRRTVLIVDDHVAFRSLARSLLEAEGFEVVGEAPDGRSAIDAALQLRPDIVVLDVQLPDLDGFTVAERLAAIDPDRPAVVLVSSRDSASYRRRLAATPARGFITKSQLSGSALSALVA